MKIKLAAALSALCGLSAIAPAAAKPKKAEAAIGEQSRPQPPSPAESAIDETSDASLVVTVRHLNGEREEFGRSLDTLELVFDGTGHLYALHIVLIGGSERDSHRWFIVDNISSFNYRFMNVAGKGRVHLRSIAPFKTRDRDEKTELTPMDMRDYR